MIQGWDFKTFLSCLFSSQLNVLVICVDEDFWLLAVTHWLWRLEISDMVLHQRGVRSLRFFIWFVAMMYLLDIMVALWLVFIFCKDLFSCHIKNYKIFVLSLTIVLIFLLQRAYYLFCKFWRLCIICRLVCGYILKSWILMIIGVVV